MRGSGGLDGKAASAVSSIHEGTSLGPLPAPVIPELRALDELREPKQVLARLSTVDWAFTEEDTSYLAHDLHPYPAKFIPQIPANLIAALSRRGELVWDPFGGSGTTALEALLLGRRVISSDINPLSTLITEAKCTALSPERRNLLQGLYSRLLSLARARDVERLVGIAWPNVERHVPKVPNLRDWFCTHALRELAYIQAEIRALDDVVAKRFALVALSAIIVSASNQDGETRYARREKDVPPGKTLRAFLRALADSLAKHEPMEELLGYRRPTTLTLDARALAEGTDVPADSVDLVITSPPYANATDYHLYHRFRLFWMGFDPRELAQKEVGSHLRHQREKRGFGLYLSDMRPVLASIATRLRAGRYAVLVVGDSVFNGETNPTARALAGAAEQLRLEVVGIVSRPVHSIRRSFIAAARRTRSEDLLILRRPPACISVYLRPPPYRMWAYEEVLRRREILGVLQVRPLENDGVLRARLDPYEVDRAHRLAFTHALEAEGGSPRWRTWQAILEDGDARKARKDPKYVTHGIHAYKGKFYPQLCKALLNLGHLAPGARVLDPFCGSGTVLLEAQLNGLRATGCDMNPLAVLISRAKTAVPTTSAVVLDRDLKDFLDRIAVDKSGVHSTEYFRSELRGEIDRWFPIPVARRLGWLLTLILRVPRSAAQGVLRVLLSSIIRQVSQQEPADLRIRRRKPPLSDAPVLPLLRERIREFRKRLQDFGERASSAPAAFLAAHVMESDARRWETFAALENQFDCVVTSPPYATALPYIDTDRLSILAILGVEGARRAQLEQQLTGSREIRERSRIELERSLSTPGLEERLGSRSAVRIVRDVDRLNGTANVGFRRRNMAALLLRYFTDMRRVFENLARVVVPGGRLSFVIGNNKTVAGKELVEIESGKALAELGEHVGWELTETIPISVTKEALLHARNSITKNVVLCFRA